MIETEIHPTSDDVQSSKNIFGKSPMRKCTGEIQSDSKKDNALFDKNDHRNVNMSQDFNHKKKHLPDTNSYPTHNNTSNSSGPGNILGSDDDFVPMPIKKITP
jgi:hypothetical protein